MLYVIHPQGKPAQAYSAEDLIQNAREQLADGLEPIYCYIFSEKRREYSRPGYLVYSTYQDGAAVVVLDADGKTGRIFTGWQSDFCIPLKEEKTA